MSDVAMLLRVTKKVQRGSKADAYLTVEPIGDVMGDESWKQINFRLPVDVRDRLLTQLQRIAKLNELSFPDKPDSKGTGTAHVVNLVTELFEHTLDEDLVRRW